MMEKNFPEGEELLKIATEKFMEWTDRLNQDDADTLMAALAHLGIDAESREALILLGFMGGLEAGLELAGGDAE